MTEHPAMSIARRCRGPHAALPEPDWAPKPEPRRRKKKPRRKAKKKTAKKKTKRAPRRAGRNSR